MTENWKRTGKRQFVLNVLGKLAVVVSFLRPEREGVVGWMDWCRWIRLNFVKWNWIREKQVRLLIASKADWSRIFGWGASKNIHRKEETSELVPFFLVFFSAFNNIHRMPSINIVYMIIAMNAMPFRFNHSVKKFVILLSIPMEWIFLLNIQRENILAYLLKEYCWDSSKDHWFLPTKS